MVGLEKRLMIREEKLGEDQAGEKASGEVKKKGEGPLTGG